MNAYLTEVSDRSGADRPPVLIAGANAAAWHRAERTIAAAGLRIADRIAIADAPQRIAQQVAASAVWLELDGDGGEAMDRLLDLMAREAEDGRYAAVVAAPPELVDTVFARTGSAPVDLVIDGDDAERASALGFALARRAAPERLADIASERSAARLRQLSDEVSRIASTLARLSTGPGAPAAVAEQPQPAVEVPEVSADTVRKVIRARRLRSRYFAEDLFADPAWDMLLDLLQAEIAQLRVPVSSLCIAAAVPATTALRWLKTMTEQGLFLRRADPHDGRRVFVELAPTASQAMRRYFAEVGQIAAA
jgi:DNA-binding MarR family transcriptional regulator